MKKGLYKGIDCIELENEYLKATFLPEYGSKLASLIDKASNEELLFQSAADQLVIPPYGAKFSDYDSSGFDEVFPSIDPCIDPQTEAQIPDHGEVWTLPWKVEMKQGNLEFTVNSPKLSYRLKKKVVLNENRLCFHYNLENLSKNTFYFIWTPHALLRCSTEMKLLVEEHLTKVINVEHSSQHLGEWGSIHPYPKTTSQKTNEIIDLSGVEPVTVGNCEKFYFTEKVKRGVCGVFNQKTDRYLKYYYPPEKIPYLGVWKTQGGYRGDYNIALEPCTGVYDNLYVAKTIKKVSSVGGLQHFDWWFDMEVGGE
ncbi:DUF5107 domain-containing protein [Bacillaceae bacterium IKA-2]|nr:DUF5107 domain-containing protein [Bacillaceae bacterium IKA-2]